MKSIKKEQIINTSRELFFKYGPGRVSIEEICKKAKVSKGTYYKYFKNKQALINYLKKTLIAEGFKKFDEISDMNISYPEKIRLMSRWRVELLSKMNNEFIKEVISKEEIAEESKKRFMKNVATAQKKGEIKPEISPDLIWLITEKLHEISTEGKWHTIFFDYGKYQDQVREIIFFGLLTSKDK